MPAIKLPQFSKLVERLQAPVIIFDLETTTFNGRPDFGITDVHCFASHPEAPGVVFEYGRLVNPENKISPHVVKLTGISQKAVDTAKPWHCDYLQHFSEWSDVAYFGGFGSNSFDIPAVQSQAVRYGQPKPALPRRFDARLMYLALSKSQSRKGKLAEVAEKFGLSPEGDLHRARCDAHLTLRLLDAMCATYGVAEVSSYILSCTPTLSAAQH